MKWLVLLTVVAHISCSSNTQGQETKLQIKQEMPLDGSLKLFWYTSSDNITSEGISFFQIAKSSDVLCREHANATSDKPVQILKVENDTIYILSPSKINDTKQKSSYKFHQVEFEPALFDKSKSPSSLKSFLVKEKCSN